MDPNQVLKDLRVIAARVVKRVDKAINDDFGMSIDAALLAENFQNLDTWIKNGGMPKDWEQFKHIEGCSLEDHRIKR